MARKIIVGAFRGLGWGGASTSAYQLSRRLQDEAELDVEFFDLGSSADALLPSLPGVERRVFPEPTHDEPSELASLVRARNPDLILGVGWKAGLALKRAAPAVPMLLLATDCEQARALLVQKRLQDSTALEEYLEQHPVDVGWPARLEFEALCGAEFAILPSPMAMPLYERFFRPFLGKIGRRPVGPAAWLVDGAGPYRASSRPFERREIDVLFVASCWSDPVANSSLASRLTRRLDGLRCHVVGEAGQRVAGAEDHGPIATPQAYFELLGNARAVVATTRFDPSAEVLFEAAAMGCNVVASRNCGNWTLCPPDLVVDSYRVENFERCARLAAAAWLPNRLSEFLENGSYGELRETLLLLPAISHQRPPAPEQHPREGSPRLGGSGRRIVRAVRQAAYRASRSMLTRWPLPPVRRLRKQAPPETTRVLYYLWQFPVRTQTFVQREVAALLDAGLDVHVLAEETSSEGYLEKSETVLRERTLTVPAPYSEAFLRHQRYFRRWKPLRYLSVYLYVLGRRYLRSKSLDSDRRTFEQAVRVAGVARELGVDHLHAPWADQCAFIALLAAKLLGIPYSVQARAFDLHRDPVREALVEKFTKACFVITNTQYNVDHIRSLIEPRDRVDLHLIYNGLDLERFPAPVEKAPLGRPVRLLSVARLVEQKGLVDLLEACARLRDKGYSIECEILGDSDPVDLNTYVELRRLARRHGLERIVTFRGAQPFRQVLKSYQEADLFVLPCVIAANGSRDITPNSLIEAMAMGLPVISTTVTGVPEIVDDRHSGLLVPPGDVDALVAAIAEVVEDDALRHRLANQARRKVETRFRSDKNVRRYVQLFRGLEG